MLSGWRVFVRFIMWYSTYTLLWISLTLLNQRVRSFLPGGDDEQNPTTSIYYYAFYRIQPGMSGIFEPGFQHIARYPSQCDGGAGDINLGIYRSRIWFFCQGTWWLEKWGRSSGRPVHIHIWSQVRRTHEFIPGDRGGCAACFDRSSIGELGDFDCWDQWV